jgi:hypothetical protein
MVVAKPEGKRPVRKLGVDESVVSELLLKN